jgi:hypothetical protein
LETLINWFRGLSRAAQITIIIAVGVFTPAVSIAFSIIFGGIGAVLSVIGFAFSLLNWKGVLFFVVVGMVFAGKAGYTWIMSEEEEGIEEDNSWDPFR